MEPIPGRRRLAAVLLAVGAACGGLSLVVTRPSRAAGKTATLSTPLWSARRAPGAIVDPMTTARQQTAARGLQDALDARAARFGAACFVVRTGNTVLASHDADHALIPA